MSNYILINEDGSMETVESLTKSDKYAADLGVIEVINIQGLVPRRLIEKNNWEDIEPR